MFFILSFHHVSSRNNASDYHQKARDGSIRNILEEEIVDSEEKISRFKKEFRNTIIFSTEQLIDIKLCIFESCTNTEIGGGLFVNSSLSKISLEQSLFSNCHAKIGGSVYIDTKQGLLESNCFSKSFSFSLYDAVYVKSSIGKMAKCAICLCGDLSSKSSIVFQFAQKINSKITDLNFSRNVNNDTGSIIDVSDAEQVFFLNSICDSIYAPKSDLLTAPSTVRVYFGCSYVLNSTVSALFNIQSYPCVQIFKDVFYKSGKTLFGNCNPNKMIITDCQFDFNYTIPQVEFRNCTHQYGAPEMLYTEECVIDISSHISFFSTTAGKAIIGFIVSFTVIMIIISSIYIYKRIIYKRERDNFYTDKFFTEFVDNTNLITISE